MRAAIGLALLSLGVCAGCDLPAALGVEAVHRNAPRSCAELIHRCMIACERDRKPGSNFDGCVDFCSEERACMSDD